MKECGTRMVDFYDPGQGYWRSLEKKLWSLLWPMCPIERHIGA